MRCAALTSLNSFFHGCTFFKEGGCSNSRGASMGCCSTRARFSRVGQGTSAVMFDNQLTLQGEWRGWRSSFARKFGVIACRSAPRFSSRLEKFVRIRCMISLGFASV